MPKSSKLTEWTAKQVHARLELREAMRQVDMGSCGGACIKPRMERLCQELTAMFASLSKEDRRVYHVTAMECRMRKVINEGTSNVFHVPLWRLTMYSRSLRCAFIATTLAFNAEVSQQG